MIAKMRKLNLAALAYDRNGIMNALQRTGAVEIREHAETEGTAALPARGEELSSYLLSLESALEILVAAADAKAKETKDKKLSVKDGFSVTYSEFAQVAEKRDEMECLVRRINALADEKSECMAEMSRLLRAYVAVKPYRLARAFDKYADTNHTKTKLGIIAPSAWESLKKSLDEISLCAYEAEKDEDNVLLAVTAHRSVFSDVESLLSGSGFTVCPYSGDKAAFAMLMELTAQIDETDAKQKRAEEELCELAPSIRDLKIYCDYIDFQLEKEQAAGKLRTTERTFFMEAFVPAEAEDRVKAELGKTEFALWYEFSDPAEDEEVPTLLKNNAVVSNFEAITNMYSPPNAREFDPNTIMAFFYSLFLGFIMGDIGYGILMLIGGGVLWYRGRKGSGLKNLSGVFAVGGIFAIIWGFLFNSLFGVQVLPYTVMPDAQKGMYSFMGISIPAVLVIAMLLGISQLFAGYVCKAVQEWRKGAILDGIFDGVTWALFSVGVALAILGLVDDFNLPSVLLTVGGIMAGVSLLLAAVTAGRKEKFIGKFTKGFGSVYGVINYVSDILSYARLYGLMLSGAIIAQIVSKYSIQFIVGGNIMFAVLGVVLMLVGHVFNLAIGLLGAYIHDARLQYVEFYGRFYTGEGELFTPLGSKRKHIIIEQ
ncbi:MAG: V-type ATP synthase subunit I [Clostridiales bacterium]|nr:V-type ATP synthase subunit I [Clostridiales bacterium]